MNYELLKIINGWSGQIPLLDNLMAFLTNNALYFFSIVLVCMWLFGGDYIKRSAIYAGFSGIISIIINYCITKIYYEPRPFVTHNDINVVVEHDADASFPSDHTAGAFGIALAIYYRHKKLGVICLIVAFLTGFSRIYIGNHYPADVLGGIIVALIGSFLITKMFKLVEKFSSICIRLYLKIPFTK